MLLLLHCQGFTDKPTRK